MKNADEKPNHRGHKRRKGNTEEDNNERDVQNDKGTDSNAVNNEDKSHGRGRKRMKQNKVAKQVEEESKQKMTIEKKVSGVHRERKIKPKMKLRRRAED